VNRLDTIYPTETELKIVKRISFYTDLKLQSRAGLSQTPFMSVSDAEAALVVKAHLGDRFWIPLQAAFEVPKCVSI
jgi:hypothetical protein